MDKMKFSLPEIGDGEDKSCLLKNCIRNTYRHVRKWAKRTETNCFRIYDREMAKYPLAIDFYAGQFCVQYFCPRREMDQPPPQELFDRTADALHTLFGAESDSIYWRTRIRREKKEQYEKAGGSREFFAVLEYGLKFWVNLKDYLDTGLFLDHREMRKMVGSLSKGKRLLNLFAYTCSFSVHAAAAGAAFTKSVDLSNTYTRWGIDNFELNAISLKNHEVVRADCLKFLDQEIRSGLKYDLIVIDPPTLSRSKKMDQMFDIQEDYIALLSKALSLLAGGGMIFFSTNARRFHFDAKAFPLCKVVDISNQLFPIDFHDRKIHQCWKISLE